MSAERLIAAYRSGIFPWYAKDDPILWWFTSPRLVLFPPELKISRRLARYRRNSEFTVTFDRAFAQVIGNCADSRSVSRRDTWISEEMQQAYLRLHQLGYAHSVECWLEDSLVGGLYGIALDRVFFGESMFSRRSNASKIAFIHLVARLRERGFQLIDCQMTTQHLVRFGAREISGSHFSKLLQTYIHTTTPDGSWKNDTKNKD